MIPASSIPLDLAGLISLQASPGTITGEAKDQSDQGELIFPAILTQLFGLALPNWSAPPSSLEPTGLVLETALQEQNQSLPAPALVQPLANNSLLIFSDPIPALSAQSVNNTQQPPEITISNDNPLPLITFPPVSREPFMMKPPPTPDTSPNPGLPPIETAPGMQQANPQFVRPVVQLSGTDVISEPKPPIKPILDHPVELPTFSLSSLRPAESQMLPAHGIADSFDSISIRSGTTVAVTPTLSPATTSYLLLVHYPARMVSLGDDRFVKEMTNERIILTASVLGNDAPVTGPTLHLPAAFTSEHRTHNLGDPQQPQVYHQIVRALHDNIRQVSENSPIRVRLQLEPPELGHVEIRLQLHGSDIEAHFQVEQPTTHALLDQQRPQLENSLAHLGITVKTIVISFRGDEFPHHRHSQSWLPWPIKKLGHRNETHPNIEPASHSEHVDVIA